MGPYESLAYFAEKERGETTRRQIASAFMEFRRLNPEASSEELRDFLSMASGGSVYMPAQLNNRRYIDRIAQQNAETKAKRLMEEAYQQQFQQAKEGEALRGMFRQYLGMYGGDEKRAMQQLEQQFAMNAGDPNAAAQLKQRLSLIDPQAEKGAWVGQLRNQELERAKDMITAGMSLQQVFSGLNPVLNGDPQITALWETWDKKKKAEAEEVDYREKQRARDEERYLQEQRDRKQAVAREIAKSMATGTSMDTIRSFYGEHAKDGEVVSMVRDLLATNFNMANKTAEATISTKVAEAQKRQADAIGLADITSFKKGGLYEGRPAVQAAASQFINAYHLNSNQLTRLSDVLTAGKVKGKTQSEIFVELKKRVFGNGGDVAPGLQAYITDATRQEMKLLRPGTYAEVLQQEVQTYQQDIQSFTEAADMAIESQDVGAMTRLMARVEQLRGIVREDIMTSVESRTFGPDNTANPATAEAAATQLEKQLAALKQRIDAEVRKHAYRPGGKAYQDKEAERKGRVNDALFRAGTSVY